MFTGIIESLGSVSRTESRGGDTRLQLTSEQLDFSDVKLGDSIAVSGACLTVVAFDENSFAADVSNETLRCTSLGKLKAGDSVNLEKAMLPTTRFGGHMVSGHVDGLAELVDISDEGRSKVLTYRVPKDLTRYIAAKGSVCLDGVSLTVNSVDSDLFTVNIIPHTMEQTTMQFYSPGQQVNLEVDVVSRYLERLLDAGEADKGLSLAALKQAGMA
jgi:riboflavin synthase